MCGRYTLTVTGRVIMNLFDLDEVPKIAPRYNIAPTQPALIVRMTEDGRCAANARWGLIPSWAKDPSIGSRLINARAETAAQKPSFRSAFRNRRCLVPADGFYEWKREASGKQPYYIRFTDGRPFAIAGLWETWRGGEERPIESFIILTTEPNSLIAPLHDRMPVILQPAAFATWLEPQPGDPPGPPSLLRPHPPEHMEAVPVSRRVNSPANDDPDCLLPV